MSWLRAPAQSGGWLRRYPPLLIIPAVLLLALIDLPSALNLPQANPSQVAEYAPVPGNSQTAAASNFGSLGLGNLGVGPAQEAPVASTAAGQSLPSSFQCVGNPPRQTADPLSPPCVPFWSGDNGGATYQGVTGSTITILFHYHLDQSSSYSGVGETNTSGPPKGYYDMSKPSDYNAFFQFQELAAWQTYFNNHYETYHRFVHFIAYNSGADQATAESNAAQGITWNTCANGTADAAQNYQDKHPFAVLDEYGGQAARVCYRNYMVQHNVLIFGGQVTWLSQAFYQQFHGLVWDWAETLERISLNYASFFCARIAPYTVSFSGNGDTGSARKYGLVYWDDSTRGGTYTTWKNLVVNDLQQTCGVKISDAATYVNYQAWSGSGTNSSQDETNMATFKNDKITTVIFLGASAEDPNAANNIQYYPEWVFVGDDINDSSLFVAGEPTNEAAHFITVTQQDLQNADGQPVERSCYEAITEVYPNIPRDTLDISYACLFFYDDLRQLFTAIQVAGPQLTPPNVDTGLHNIPPHPSTGPDQPSCFYLPGDYTCYKDAALEWWDPTAQPAQQCTGSCNRSGSYANGCWRMWEGGFRYLPGGWPKANALTGSTPNDICNLYQGGSGGIFINAPPAP